MKLRVRDVQTRRELDLEEQIPAAELDVETADHPRLVKPVDVQVHAEIQDDEVFAQIGAEARVQLPCARCLEPFETTLSLQCEATAPITQDYLDVTEEVRQQLLLALPPQPLCRDNCKGICASCGKNLNKGACACHKGQAPSTFDVLKNLKLN